MGLVLSQVEEGWVWLLRKQEGENPPLLDVTLYCRGFPSLSHKER